MIVVLLGVSGAGKTTVGKFLSERLGWPLLDADDFHPPANIEKMRSGIPLTDDDRWPWLDRLNGLLKDEESHGESALLACSALKQKYRDRLPGRRSDLRWVHLKGRFELIDDMRDFERPEVKDAQDRRIGLISDTLRQELLQRGMYRLADNSAAARLIIGLKAQQELHGCNGCEIDIGKALGADVIIIG